MGELVHRSWWFVGSLFQSGYTVAPFKTEMFFIIISIVARTKRQGAAPCHFPHHPQGSKLMTNGSQNAPRFLRMRLKNESGRTVHSFVSSAVSNISLLCAQQMYCAPKNKWLGALMRLNVKMNFEP